VPTAAAYVRLSVTPQCNACQALSDEPPCLSLLGLFVRSLRCERDTRANAGSCYDACMHTALLPLCFVLLLPVTLCYTDHRGNEVARSIVLLSLVEAWSCMSAPRIHWHNNVFFFFSEIKTSSINSDGSPLCHPSCLAFWRICLTRMIRKA
jgi:hypothetical protein